MGISQISFHIYGSLPDDTCGLEFRSFSEGWQTCTTKLREKRGVDLIKTAKLLSKKTSAPVLIFEIIDSEAVCFDFYLDGKRAAGYTDYIEIRTKNIYSVPAMIGYAEGNKKRLSNILSCRDAEEKLFMLEELFGVCLAPPLELISEPEILVRQRGDEHYRRFMEQENMLKGKNAPVDFVGKSMILPEGYFVSGFDAENRLILDNGSGIFVVDKTLKIVAKISIKGEVDDIVDNYLLTTTGDSFCGYVYEPRAVVRIYELVDNSK